MPLMMRTGLSMVVSLVMLAGVRGQSFTDQGLMSGTGMMLVPTPNSAPVAEFGLQTARVEFLRPGERGMNVISFTGGFSSHVEGYIRFSGEQIGMPSSVISYGFGAKIRSPFRISFAEKYAFWFESASTEQVRQRSLYPPNVIRGGISLAYGTDGVNPVVLGGVTSVEGAISALAGCGVTVAAGHEAQVSAEMVYGYTGGQSLHAILGASLRVLPHVSIHAMPGYSTSPSASTWFVSVGISCSTADIDYHPVRASTDGEFILPSIEEIESQMQGEKKNE